MPLKRNCGNCKYKVNKGISDTYGNVPYKSCFAVPPDDQGNRAKITDETRTVCGLHKEKK